MASGVILGRAVLPLRVSGAVKPRPGGGMPKSLKGRGRDADSCAAFMEGVSDGELWGWDSYKSMNSGNAKLESDLPTVDAAATSIFERGFSL